ncbi:hypothetical protein M758_8G165800 [Ceratodon purpureus]|nr:hypothetical protein M758_8G165800 [Ceratodon purpureus]
MRGCWTWSASVRWRKKNAVLITYCLLQMRKTGFAVKDGLHQVQGCRVVFLNIPEAQYMKKPGGRRLLAPPTI